MLTEEEQYDRAALDGCVRLATQNAYRTLRFPLAKPSSNGGGTPAATGLEQRERARLRARGVRVVKLPGQDRYLARSRTYEPGSYFELWVSPWGHVRCS